MWKSRAILPIAALVSLLSSCGAEPPGSGETDLVLTLDGGVSAAGSKTFYSISAVLSLCEQPDASNNESALVLPEGCTEQADFLDEPLVEHTARELRIRGHEQVDRVESADWVLALGIVARPFWDLGERACFERDELAGCAAPLTDEDIQIPRNSLVIQLFDARAARDDELVLSWVGTVDRRYSSGRALGLGGAPADPDQAFQQGDWVAWRTGVTQAFAQSPQLGAVETP